ncbi:MAG TPA: hypothetical protein VMJ10_19015 [Kofleriaceae bacterium]|nr:hypothetical protein [Kofleriaceae bacterium]
MRVALNLACAAASFVSCHEPEPHRPGVPVAHFALSFTSDGLSFGRHDMQFTSDDWQAEDQCHRGDDPKARRLKISIAYHGFVILTVTATNVDVAFPWSHVVLERTACTKFDLGEQQIAGGMLRGAIHLSCAVAGTDNRVVLDVDYVCPP